MVGAEQELPGPLLERLARFDMVKGQASTLRSRESQDSKMMVKVVKLTDKQAEVEISGPPEHTQSDNRSHFAAEPGCSS